MYPSDIRDAQFLLPNGRIPVLFCAIAMLTLSGCGGGSSGTGLVESPPPPAMPPPPPPSTIGPVMFTLDNSVSASAALGPEGGQFVLDVPGGAIFTVYVPPGAFFAASTMVSMTAVIDTQGLPPGFTPIAAMSFGPSGSVFAREPEIEIELRNLSRPVGNVVLFLANDDGTGLTYLVPQGDDLVTTVLGDGPFRAAVPHFSGVVVATSDPNGPGIPDDTADGDTISEAQKEAVRKINEIIEKEARKDLAGDGAPLDIGSETEPVFAEWEADLAARAAALGENSPLQDFIDIMNEAIRIEKARDSLVSDNISATLEGTAAGDAAIQKLRQQIDALNEQCNSGESASPRALIERIDLLNSLNQASLLLDDTLLTLAPPDLCLSISVNPESVIDFVPSQQTLVAEVIDAEGEPVDLSSINSTIAWLAPDLNELRQNPVAFEFLQQGESEATALLGSKTVILEASVDMFGIPSLLGIWSATVSGTSSGCDDPEDDGPGTASVPISISGQAVTGISPIAISIGGNGGQSGASIDLIDIQIDNVTVTSTTLSGGARGEASYTIVEEEIDDNGNPVTFTTTGSANFTGTLANGEFNFSGTARGSSNCFSEGTLTLRRP